jgi:hypothetical protein
MVQLLSAIHHGFDGCDRLSIVYNLAPQTKPYPPPPHISHLPASAAHYLSAPFSTTHDTLRRGATAAAPSRHGDLVSTHDPHHQPLLLTLSPFRALPLTASLVMETLWRRPTPVNPRSAAQHIVVLRSPRPRSSHRPI